MCFMETDIVNLTTSAQSVEEELMYYQREIGSCFSWIYALFQRKINDHKKKTIVHKVVSPPTRANNADATTGIEGTLWTFIANTKTSQSIKTIEFCHHKQ